MLGNKYGKPLPFLPDNYHLNVYQIKWQCNLSVLSASTSIAAGFVAAFNAKTTDIL